MDDSIAAAVVVDDDDLVVKIVDYPINFHYRSYG
jgi:hypothetical protein